MSVDAYVETRDLGFDEALKLRQSPRVGRSG